MRDAIDEVISLTREHDVMTAPAAMVLPDGYDDDSER
jgi:hypothetical protein